MQETNCQSLKNADDVIQDLSKNSEVQPAKKLKDLFVQFSVNSKIKKKIKDILRYLKDVSKSMRQAKHQYQIIRNKVERAPIYKAVKGDQVDEIFGGYIN